MALRVRRLRTCTFLHAGVKSLPPAARVIPEKASTEEQALADAYQMLDWPPHALPWWLDRERHRAMRRTLRGAEERLLR